MSSPSELNEDESDDAYLRYRPCRRRSAYQTETVLSQRRRTSVIEIGRTVVDSTTMTEAVPGMNGRTRSVGHEPYTFEMDPRGRALTVVDRRSYGTLDAQEAGKLPSPRRLAITFF